MESTLSWPHPQPAPRWREVVVPKEHGSWSLAFEPLVLALLVAPSVAGGFLAAAVTAAFFARRPLRIAITDARAGRRAAARRALAVLAVVAGLAFAGALAWGGAHWLAWLAPALAAGALFLVFDLRQAGREEAAEIAGAAAFASLPAAFAILGGANPASAVALALVMIGRAVPTVLSVRAVLRAAKTGRRRDGPALIAVAVALAVGIVLARTGIAPFTAVAFLALFALRSFALLVFPRPARRGRVLGTIEAVAGALFVIALVGTWTW